MAAKLQDPATLIASDLRIVVWLRDQVLPWSVATDAVIITLNCVLMLALGLLNGGQLPARAANALTMLYIVYLTITLVVQFA